MSVPAASTVITSASVVLFSVTCAAPSPMSRVPEPLASSHTPTDFRPRWDTSCLPYRAPRSVATLAVLTTVSDIGESPVFSSGLTLRPLVRSRRGSALALRVVQESTDQPTYPFRCGVLLGLGLVAQPRDVERRTIKPWLGMVL